MIKNICQSDESKKILILNGSHSEIPLINAAKKLGFFVITTGNIPSLIGHNYSDQYVQEDYSKQERILSLARELRIDAICACANDFGATTAAYVAEKMQLPGHDSYEVSLLLHQKDLFKDFALKHKIRTPYAEKYESENLAISAAYKYQYPLIVKPVDMTGGKGVSIVESCLEYEIAIKHAFKKSIAKRIVVEEYFYGTQHSMSTFLVNQQVKFAYSDNEFSYLNPFFVSTSSAPAVAIDKYKQKLITDIEKLATLLQLVDGIFHIQFLANGDEATIIDITRRCSGDMYPYPINFSTDTDWSEWIIKAETGLACNDFPNLKQKGNYGRHCIMSHKNGRIKNIEIKKKLKPFIIDEIMWYEKGEHIDDYLTQKVGMLFLRYDTEAQMQKLTLELNQLVKINLME